MRTCGRTRTVCTVCDLLSSFCVVVACRNNHFNCLFKHGRALYQLITDQGYLGVPEVTHTHTHTRTEHISLPRPGTCVCTQKLTGLEGYGVCDVCVCVCVRWCGSASTHSMETHSCVEEIFCHTRPRRRCIDTHTHTRTHTHTHWRLGHRLPRGPKRHGP